MRNPYFFNRKDETNANKNINVECVDCIHDTLVVVMLRWVIITLITIPKLLSIPLVPANVKKAPMQTNHARQESSDTVNILSQNKDYDLGESQFLIITKKDFYEWLLDLTDCWFLLVGTKKSWLQSTHESSKLSSKKLIAVQSFCNFHDYKISSISFTKINDNLAQFEILWMNGYNYSN